MRGKPQFDEALQILRDWLKLEPDPRRRSIINVLIRKFEQGIQLTEDELDDLKMFNVRLPDFDGDMVGWLPDDFTYDEDDDDEDDNAT